MLKTSTAIADIAAAVGELKAVELVAKAGFDAYDLSLFEMARFDYNAQQLVLTGHPLQSKEALAYVRQIRQVADDNGIHCNQSHAPFPVYFPPILDLQKQAIEFTAEAGGKICVIHPDNYKGPEQNAQMYLELLPFAKSCGVKLAAENMWNWSVERNEPCKSACSDPKSFLAHLQAVNDPFLVACVDIGHAEMRTLGTTAAEMIRSLASHLQALHVHDNDCWNDSHSLPFTQKIDFDAVACALREIGYDGYITLEVEHYCCKSDPETVPEKVQNMYRSARKLAEMI